MYCVECGRELTDENYQEEECCNECGGCLCDNCWMESCEGNCTECQDEIDDWEDDEDDDSWDYEDDWYDDCEDDEDDEEDN